MTEPADVRVVQCNYRTGTKICKPGARAYLSQVPGDHARIKVVARSRSGRWVTRWESLQNLCNFRFKTLCPNDPIYKRMESSNLPVVPGAWDQRILDFLNRGCEAVTQ